MIQLKQLDPRSKVPFKATVEAAGFDLFALEPGCIQPEQTLLIKLGFSCAFEPGIVAILKTRSGMALKGLTVRAGVIDSDYRGEWGVVLHNSGRMAYYFGAEKAIAQVIFVKHLEADFKIVEAVDYSVRGSGGFGSTDKENQ